MAKKRVLQLNELEEIHSDTYKSSRIYKEKMKRGHDKHIHWREFWVGDLVLLFNSRLKLFLGKFRSRWSSPFEVKKILSYGAIKVRMEDMGTFKVNGSRLKHYIAGEPIDGKVTHDLLDGASS